jgi:hypothetical protein
MMPDRATSLAAGVKVLELVRRRFRLLTLPCQRLSSER